MKNPPYCCVRPLHESDLDALADLMKADPALPPEKLLSFAPTADNLHRQTIGDPDFNPQLMTGIFSNKRLIGSVAGINRHWKQGVENVGFIKWLIVHPEFRRQGLGTMLLESIQQQFADMGITALRFGGSAPWYLLPGVPQKATELQALLKKQSWQLSSERVNLQVNLNEITQPPAAPPEGCQIAEVSPENRDKALDFIEKNFTVSWAIESEEVFKSSSNGLLIICNTQDSEIAGFAAVGATNPNWLGPIGVAKNHRGRGIGRALLNSALQAAADRNIRHICIPWAEEKFYRHTLLQPPHRTIFVKATLNREPRSLST